MTLHAYECPECGRREVVERSDMVDRDSHGRPLCTRDGMAMLPVVLDRQDTREELAAAFGGR